MYNDQDLFDKRSVIGGKLEKILAERGYTKISFSRECGISRPTLDKILSGNNNSKANYDKHMEKILHTLSLSSDELLGNVHNPYNKTREIRSYFQWSKEDLASAVSIPEERLLEIESGAPAKVSEIRDIAACLGTSTRCIDNTEYFFPQVAHPATIMDIYYGDNACFSGFYGHIGIKPINNHEYLWYPITGHSYNLIRDRMNSERLVVPCMNNKLLYINTNNVSHIVLLPDDSDTPSFGNWDSKIDSGGTPLVVFEALDDYFMYENEKEAIAEGLFSSKFYQFMTEIIQENNWNEELIDKLLHTIVIYYNDGEVFKDRIVFGESCSLVDEIRWSYESDGLDEKFVEFEDDNLSTIYINTEKVSVIECPLVETENAICELFEGIEGYEH